MITVDCCIYSHFLFTCTFIIMWLCSESLLLTNECLHCHVPPLTCHKVPSCQLYLILIQTHSKQYRHHPLEVIKAVKHWAFSELPSLQWYSLWVLHTIMCPQFEKAKRIKCNIPISLHNKTTEIQLANKGDANKTVISVKRIGDICPVCYKYDMRKFWKNSQCYSGTGSVHFVGKGQNNKEKLF